METIQEYLLIGGIIFFSVLLYFMKPKLIVFITSSSKGKKGLMFHGGFSLVFIAVFYLFGYRGTELLYVSFLIVFIVFMIWLWFNYRDMDVLISSRYGQLAATLVFFGIILLIWLVFRFLI